MQKKYYFNNKEKMSGANLIMCNGKELIHVFYVDKNKRIYVREENLQNFFMKNKPVQYDVHKNIMFFKPLGPQRRKKN